MSYPEQSEFLVEVDERQEEEAHINYDIATYPSDYTLSGIVKMWEDGDITIPDFQREFVWTIKQASLLIESFLLGLPVPSIFFYIDEANKNLVIDGQQRILSTVFYFGGYFGQEKKRKFPLQGLDKSSPYYQKTYNDLPNAAQRKLRGTVLRAINVRQLSPSGEKTSIFHIFERLNTGGKALNSQEIRNVVFRGDFVNILQDLNRENNWQSILGKTRPSKNQADVELVLRIFALRNGASHYEKPMKTYLNRVMKENQKGNTQDIQDFQQSFIKISKLVMDKLKEKPFHLRGPLNTSALDSIFCTLIQYDHKIPNDLDNRYEKLIKDSEFKVFTTTGTTDTATVKGRFDLVKKYLID